MQPAKKTPTLQRHARLLPRGQTGGAPSHAVEDRTKYRMLVGADVYVTRLGHRFPGQPPPPPGSSASLLSAVEEPVVVTGSLHDELTCTAKGAEVRGVEGTGVVEKGSVLASRPCYRCVGFMHNVGVKRVFWTNEEGVWEGAKVRDLVDELEGIGGCGGEDGEEYEGHGVGSRVYVTKHEVLMLRRLLGEGGG